MPLRISFIKYEKLNTNGKLVVDFLSDLIDQIYIYIHSLEDRVFESVDQFVELMRIAKEHRNTQLVYDDSESFYREITTVDFKESVGFHYKNSVEDILEKLLDLNLGQDENSLLSILDIVINAKFKKELCYNAGPRGWYSKCLYRTKCGRYCPIL
ncbi:hypothetical protein [Wuhan arthropod virus 1]|uniref:hypothetical protein n=1 Tax=Wuhan arthropod virus 1 TaxID=1923690 RepID=UPI000909EA3D|nr:hypothetical protein [Wuhan arthropod virus 1]APG77753.1 hypothetical protein [Wuhan arthropod virus 1]